MTVFPAIIPNSIEFDFGAQNLSEVGTIGGGPIRFRHSLRVSNQRLRLIYNGLLQSQINQLRDHFYDVSGTHDYFDLPAAIWGGYAPVPADSVVRYLNQPEETHTGLHYNTTIDLVAIVGAILLYILNGGGAAQPALAPFNSLVFNGTAPFILNCGTADPSAPAAQLLLQGGGANQ